IFGRLRLRAVELFIGADQATWREVRSVEVPSELDQHPVSVCSDALDDLADGSDDGGIALEPRRLEPLLPPLAQVEEPQHSGPLEALVMVQVLCHGRRDVADACEGPVACDEHPAADADRERGGDEHAESEQERGLSVHGSRQGTRGSSAVVLRGCGAGLLKVEDPRADKCCRASGPSIRGRKRWCGRCSIASRSGARPRKQGSRSSSSWWSSLSSASSSPSPFPPFSAPGPAPRTVPRKLTFETATSPRPRSTR